MPLHWLEQKVMHYTVRKARDQETGDNTVQEESIPASTSGWRRGSRRCGGSRTGGDLARSSLVQVGALKERGCILNGERWGIFQRWGASYIGKQP